MNPPILREAKSAKLSVKAIEAAHAARPIPAAEAHPTMANIARAHAALV